MEERETLELVIPSQEGQKEPKQPKRRKSCSRRCLVHCLVYLVILLLLVGAAVGGSAFAFNRYVSPQIGGIGFFDAARLMSGLYTGERNRNKIVTDPATEQDLNDFYDELYTHVFLSVKSETQLKEQFAALSEEDKAQWVTKIEADKDYGIAYGKAKDAEKPALLCDYYVQKNRYPLTVATILDAVDVKSMVGSGDDKNDENEFAAAEDAQENGDLKEKLSTLLSGLSLDFRNNQALSDFDYTKDASYPANLSAVQMQITGKEITALVSEILESMSSVLSDVLANSLGGDSSEEGEEDGPSLAEQLSQLNMSDYFKVPQVIISGDDSVVTNTMTEAQKAAAFNRTVCLTATVEIRIGALLSSSALQNALGSAVEQAMPGKAALAKVVLGVIKGILPKTLFLTAGVYPYDNTRDILFTINNYSEKDQANLVKVINTVTKGGINLGGDQETEPQDESEESVSMMQELNTKVYDLFAKLDDMGVPITFATVQTESGPTVGLTFAHVQLLLNFLGLNGDDGVTAYEFMTVLKCIFSQPEDGAAVNANLSALYTELEQKYGIPHTYWEEKGLFGTLSDNASDVLKQIHLDGVTFAANDNMRIAVQDAELVALVKDAIANLKSDSGETAAAEEGGSMLDSLKDALSFHVFSIHKVENNLYSITAKVSIGIDDLLQDVLKGEDGILSTFRSAFPEKMSLGMTLYVATEDDVIKTYSPEGHPIAYLLNAFDETYSNRVVDTLTRMIAKLGGNELNINSLGDKIGDTMSSVFDSVKDALHCDLHVKEGGILLPSLYEIIHGFGENQVENKDTLTPADLPSVQQIQHVLSAVFNYTPEAAETYDGTQADALLDSLKSKYYLNLDLTANDLFSGSDLSDKFSGNFINTAAMYADTRTLEQLNVPIDAKALAELIQRSGKTDSITVDGLVSGVSIIGCNYATEGGNLYLNLRFKATLSTEDGDGELAISQLTPSALYLTCKVLLHNETDTYSEAAPRFVTEIAINNDQAATGDLLRLVKVFTGNDVDTSSVSNTVKDAMTTAFDTVEDNLEVDYTDRLVIANIFAYLTNGKLVTTDGKTGYDRTQHMTNKDDSPTTPTQLMNRMRELGKAVTMADFATNMVVWQGGAPAAEGTRYNDNTFTTADEDAFYAQLQDDYFFLVKPTKDSFTSENNIFSDLSASTLGNFFRLTGDSGLYHYTGAQKKARLSDKAIGSLVKSQNAVTVSSDYIESVEVTSLSMRIVGEQLRIEITTKVVTKGNDLLPAVFYLTAISTADATAATKSFDTAIALNRFTAADLDDFFSNTGFLGTINLNDTIDTTSVKNSISSALNELFNDKLKDYVESYGNYESNDVRGKGYLEFYTIYHKIVDTLGINRATYTNADSDIQSVIVALNTDYSTGILCTSNPSDGSETLMLDPLGMSDRYFAKELRAKLAEEGKSADMVQSIFFVNEYTGNASTVYADWQEMLDHVDTTKNFAFADGKNYIVTSAKFSKGDLNMEGMSLLKDIESIYTTLVIDGDSKDVVYTFFNDMTDTQTDMLFSILTGDTTRTNIEQSVKDLLNNPLYATYVHFSQNADSSFGSYVGYMHP